MATPICGIRERGLLRNGTNCDQKYLDAPEPSGKLDSGLLFILADFKTKISVFISLIFIDVFYSVLLQILFEIAVNSIEHY